jgi:hypothetical protein
MVWHCSNHSVAKIGLGITKLPSAAGAADSSGHPAANAGAANNIGSDKVIAAAISVFICTFTDVYNDDARPLRQSPAQALYRYL